MTRFCQVADYYIHILEREWRRLKFPKILFFGGAKHACKSIISIRTTNYTFFKKSLKIEGFKSFFFPLNKTYDFWTNFQSGQKERTGETEGTKQKDGTERGKERARKKERKGYIPRRGGGGKLIISTLTKKRKISTPYIVYNIIYRLI